MYYDTIVIGAGQAGLSMGYYLKLFKAKKQNFILLDKADEVGASWKSRYDSLVLFTPRMYNALPGLDFEGDQHGFPNKNEVVYYLKRYAKIHAPPISFNTEILNLKYINDTYSIQTTKGKFEGKKVVIASGAFQTPKIPAFSKDLSPDINQLHSSQYKNPSQLIEGNVLVAGGGNSGTQIAVELAKERETFLSIGSKLTYLPLTINNKSIFWWFDKVGILKASAGSFIGKAIQRNGDPIFGYELKNAIKNQEIKMKPRLVNTEKNDLIFADTSKINVDNIIWATGFEGSYSWIEIDGAIENGEVIHKRGISPKNGLYFIGLPWQHRRGSALLQGVGFDAKFIAEHITQG